MDLHGFARKYSMTVENDREIFHGDSHELNCSIAVGTPSWLAPERREETLASLDRVGVRFAGLLVAFFAVLHHFILAANAQAPANLPASVAFITERALVLGVVVLMGMQVRHFYRKPA
jgi:hypothetical protein